MRNCASQDPVGKIAVIGMAGRYPDAWNIEEYWENLRQGRECITFFTDDELRAAGVSEEMIENPAYVKAKGICPGTFLFDAGFFGYAPREAEFIDPQQRVFLECAWEALEHAGYDPISYPGRIGLFAGSGAAQYSFELRCMPNIHQLVDELTLASYSDKDFLTTRVAYKLNLRGPCVTLQTACSTSLVSIVIACNSLLSYQCDMAMGGGVTLIMHEREGHLYQEGGIHSPDGHCRAFDAQARGISGGSGAGLVVLKRLEDALAAGDTIHAVVLGVGISNDGSGRIGFSAPGVNGQVTAASDAIAMAGINPETIGYIECHGTATPLGDPIEIKALTNAFRAYTGKKQFCGVGSVKTNIGHTDTAAGVAGFTKAVLALENKLIPASLNFSRPNPEIDFENSPFYVQSERKKWEAGDISRRASVSSFGLGGTNAHVVLEEAPEPEPAAAARPWNLLVWSARTPEALEKMTVNLLRHLKTRPQDSIADIAWTLQVGRRIFPHRKMLVCRDAQDAIKALEAGAVDRLLVSCREREAGPVAFAFPGQGPQYINMGRRLYAHERVFRENVDHCAEILKPLLGRDIREILFSAPEEAEKAAGPLDRIEFTTPILFTVEYAVAQLWLAWGIVPAGMIGHSTGEYAAACVAGVFSVEDALRLVTVRGRLMQRLPAGAMTSVLLSPEHLSPLLEKVTGVSIAAINTPGACVVSGDTDGMNALEKILAERQTPFRRLRISHASHSPMMEPMLEDFRKEFEKTAFNAPRIPYISNLTGTWITTEEAIDPGYWVRHVRQTVRFSEGVTELLREPNRIVLECGPGRMLSSLITQHPARGAEHVALPSLPHPKDDAQSDSEFLLNAAGCLWLEGCAFDWKAFHDGEKRRRIPLPSYPFERRRYQLTGSVDRVTEQAAIASPVSNGNHVRPFLASSHPRPNLPTAYVTPRNELEETIAGVWQESLGIDAIGVHDNFVRLGGHSLLAIQVAARLRDVLEVEFTVAGLYKTPTIAGLAMAVIEKLTKDIDPAALEDLMAGLERGQP